MEIVAEKIGKGGGAGRQNAVAPYHGSGLTARDQAAAETRNRRRRDIGFYGLNRRRHPPLPSRRRYARNRHGRPYGARLNVGVSFGCISPRLIEAAAWGHCQRT